MWIRRNLCGNIQRHRFRSCLSEHDLVPRISERVLGDTEATVVVRADKTVALQYIVYVMDAVNTINERDGTKHKLILATAPKEA